MKKSTILRKAAKRIAGKKEFCICWAVHNITTLNCDSLYHQLGEGISKNGKAIIGDIKTAMGVASYVDQWLGENCKEFAQFQTACNDNWPLVGEKQYKKAMRDYRVRWCHHMADQYEANGE